MVFTLFLWLKRIIKEETMATHPNTDIQTRAVNLRVRIDTRALIDRAAKAHGKTRSDFMIDAARRAAEDALLDQTLVCVDQKTYDLFLKVLDQPPCGEGFDRLMKVRKPWT
jgi:uncharacterized protein (DUF1778 family)